MCRSTAVQRGNFSASSRSHTRWWIMHEDTAGRSRCCEQHYLKGVQQLCMGGEISSSRKIIGGGDCATLHVLSRVTPRDQWDSWSGGTCDGTACMARQTVVFEYQGHWRWVRKGGIKGGCSIALDD